MNNIIYESEDILIEKRIFPDTVVSLTNKGQIKLAINKKPCIIII